MKPPVVWYAAMLAEEWELYQPIVDEFTGKTGTQVQVELYGGDWDGLMEDLSSEVDSGERVADLVKVDDFMVPQAKEYVQDLTKWVDEWGEWDQL